MTQLDAWLGGSGVSPLNWVGGGLNCMWSIFEFKKFQVSKPIQCIHFPPKLGWLIPSLIGFEWFKCIYGPYNKPHRISDWFTNNYDTGLASLKRGLAWLGLFPFLIEWEIWREKKWKENYMVESHALVRGCVGV